MKNMQLLATCAVTSLLALALVAACSDADTDRGEIDAGFCGDRGEAIDLDGEVLCVYEKNVVVETGFACPAEVANAFEHGDVLICSNDPDLGDPERDRARDRYRDRVPVPDNNLSNNNTSENSSENNTDPGPCTSDADCAPGQVCADDNGDGVNACVAAVACAASADCQMGESCVDGFCAITPLGDECTADADCDEGLSCTGGRCEVHCTEGDLDGDGVCGAEDCDDQDPTASPELMEIDGDGIDNDCDGEIDELGEMPDVCNSDADCALGQVCVNGLCVAQ